MWSKLARNAIADGLLGIRMVLRILSISAFLYPRQVGQIDRVFGCGRGRRSFDRGVMTDTGNHTLQFGHDYPVIFLVVCLGDFSGLTGLGDAIVAIFVANILQNFFNTPPELSSASPWSSSALTWSSPASPWSSSSPQTELLSLSEAKYEKECQGEQYGSKQHR